MTVTFRAEPVGSLYGVARYVNGALHAWILEPQASRELAYLTALKLNKLTSPGFGP